MSTTKKKFTRAQAEAALAKGSDPTQFTDHENYHVRFKAWKKMGKPLPEESEIDSFLFKLFGKDSSKMSEDQQKSTLASLKIRASLV